MIGRKQTNKSVKKMYKDEKIPFIETTVTFRTPVERNSELYEHFNGLVAHQYLVLSDINQKVNEVVGESFEADVLSVHSKYSNNN